MTMTGHLPLCLLVLAGLALLTQGVQSKTAKDLPLSVAEMQSLVEELRGDDDRLMRWGATEHTAQVQGAGKACAETKMMDIFTTMTSLALAPDRNDHADWLFLSADYATLCLIDNPSNREVFAKVPDIYEATANMIHVHIKVETSYHDKEQFFLHRLPAKAAQMIYVAVFGNASNQLGFYDAGVIPPLMSIINDYATSLQEHLDHIEELDADEDSEQPDPSKTLPLTAMWAAAALQNLAASYCDTPGDGRCYWAWGDLHDPQSEIRHLQLDNDSKPIIGDGQKMRTAMLETDIEEFWSDSVETIICHMPSEPMLNLFGGVTGGNSIHEQSDEELWLASVTDAKLHDPRGDPDIHGEQHASHERLETLVAWAVAGMIKNVALNDNAKTVTMMEHLLPCLCHLGQSADWLENGKAQQAILRLRRSDPCWFEDDPDGPEKEETDKDEEDEDEADEVMEVEDDDYMSDRPRSLPCVDGHFLDERGFNCPRYEDEDVAQECDDHHDPTTGRTARAACCACGGGLLEENDYKYEEEL